MRTTLTKLPFKPSRFILQVIIFVNIFYSVPVQAQTFYKVQHTSGTVNYGNTAVTVTPGAGIVKTGNGCLGTNYWIGATSGNVNLYNFALAHATNHIRFSIQVAQKNESFRFTVNGQHYQLSYSELSQLSGGSGCTYTNAFVINGNGDIEDTMTTYHEGGVLIDIIRPNIYSFSAEQTNIIAAGSWLITYFEEDTTSFIKQPYTDTVLCPGQTFPLVYSTSFNFRSNNSFTAQLSNASGSFTSPVNIGSHADTVGDTIWCTVPVNATPGNGYRIRLLSSNPQDTSLDNQVDIRIKAAPQALTNSSNSPVCTTDTLRLNGGSSSSGITWAWSGPNSFSSGAEDTIIANSTMSHAGDYILTATLNSTGCSFSDTTTVVMRPTPDKPTAGSNSPVCETLGLQLTSSSTTNGVSYGWSGPSYSSATQNPTVTGSAAMSQAGDYISTVTINGCSNRDTTTVVILPKPAKPTAAAPNSPLCAHQDLQLTATAITGATYTWFGPAAFTANTQNPTRVYTQLSHSGAYHVFANLNGCISDTDSVVVVVNTDPVVNIFPTPGTSICKGEQAIFTAIPTNGGTVGYNWLLNGVSTGITTVAYSTNNLNNGDIITCLMTSTGTCATTFTDTSNYIQMVVQATKTPSVSITANPTTSLFPNQPITFTATATDAGVSPTYQWKRNGANVGGATSAIWGANANFLDNNDDICVLITSDYVCPEPDTALSNCIKLAIRVGIDDIDNDNNINIYPNPTSHSVMITSSVDIEKIEVSNLLGQRVLVRVSPDLKNGGGISSASNTPLAPLKRGSVVVDMSSLAAGVYVVQVNGEYVSRVVKE